MFTLPFRVRLHVFRFGVYDANGKLYWTYRTQERAQRQADKLNANYPQGSQCTNCL